MAGNSFLNAFALFYLLIVYPIGFVITASIYHPIVDQMDTTLGGIGWVTPQWVLDSRSNYEFIVFDGSKYFMWFAIAVTTLSSFINGYNFREWLFGSIVAIIVTALLTYFGGLVWNSFVANATGILDFTDFVNEFANLTSQFTNILLVNLFAGILSFIWGKGKAGADFA